MVGAVAASSTGCCHLDWVCGRNSFALPGVLYVFDGRQPMMSSWKMSLTKSFPAIRATPVSACVTTVALAILILVSVSARADEARDRFEFWAECQPMELVVEDLNDNAATIGLTEDSIEVAVRSRLRAARLYIESSDHFLYVNVNVHPVAFSTHVSFEKWLTDSMSGESAQGSTWSISSVGTHRKDANYILGGISQYVDTFIDEYLRVNESACSG